MQMGNLPALLLVAVLVSSALAVTGVAGEDAAMTVSVGSVPPEVISVSVSPDPVMMYPCPATTQITVTAMVYHPNSIDYLDNVAITAISPVDFSVDLPVVMGSENRGHLQATYTATINLPCCTPHGVYTLLVTATDKSGNEDSATTEFMVEATIAIRATDMNFGMVVPGDSGTAATTITCTGNVDIALADLHPLGQNNPTYEGVMWTDMASGNDRISADNLKISWDSATTLACGESAHAEFTLTVPLGTPPGTYTGTLTLTPTAVYLNFKF